MQHRKFDTPKTNDCSSANSLRINSKKNKAILFNPYQKHLNFDLNIHIVAEIVEVTSEAKILGIIFNEHLLWTSQVDHVLTNIAKMARILCYFRYILPTRLKLLIYNSLFSTDINYCSLVWSPTSKSNINRILLYQKKALRHIANAQWDAPTHNRFLNYKILPFPQLYNYRLTVVYKNSVKNNNLAFLSMCNLEAFLAASYSFRHQAKWLIPFARTNQGLNSVETG